MQETPETRRVTQGMRVKARLLGLAVAAGLVFPQTGLAAPPTTGPAVQSDISAPGPLGALKGTLLAPANAGPHTPVVLILPGSGPTDRDGNNSRGLKAGTYRLLAEGLAAQGISSVRIDKRGLLASAGAVADGNAVTISDYVQDTQAWTKTIQSRTGAGCVWLLGHSEGGLVALASAVQKPEALCGLILASTPGRSVAEVLRTQLASTPYATQGNTAINTLLAGKTVDPATLPDALKPIFNPAVQGFLKDMFRYSPTQLIARLHKPVLIIQGTRDMQVSAQDAQALAASDPSAVLKLFPDTNHFLKTQTQDGKLAMLATATDPALPLAPDVVETVSQFITHTKQADAAQ